MRPVTTTSLRALCAAMAALGLWGCGAAPRQPAPLTAVTALDREAEQARDTWQQPDTVVRHLRIEPGMRVADIGAGNGYLLGRLAQAVGPQGVVYAVEVQPALIAQLQARVRAEGWTNVVVVQASPAGVLLPEPIDRAVLLHSYRELAQPLAMLRSLKAWLHAGGRVLAVDFLLPPDPDSGSVPAHALPPAVQRVDPQTLEAEARGAGLVATAHYALLPHQHMAVFVNAEELTSQQLEGLQDLALPADPTPLEAPSLVAP
jgi:arsenite methyltransferase